MLPGDIRLCSTTGIRLLRRAGMFTCLAILLLGGCGTASIEDYRDRSPAFMPEDFFNGALSAHGVVKDFSGTAIRHFNADIIACWSEGVGTLNELFIFDDGEQQTRIWTLTPSGDQTYIGTAGDVIGAGSARWEGNAMFLDYTLRIALEDSSIDVHIDDRMYRISENVVVNESKMRKWGFGVGEILLTLIKHPEQPADCSA
ncbi:DUF3833 domain-containing protein [Luminiphilus sp.]|nr:DUF3833 domain-containing protein [Luminiphilus sp.]MDB2365255.1 DUF3833 domain-containing protein [Luminiphilus sp.]MDB2688842.1 DUF3833 domain-containing protein [Luminiphilus sp.]MDC1160679.1 DUF3833 domain-containing protein [Luminiphilus sp.]